MVGPDTKSGHSAQVAVQHRVLPGRRRGILDFRGQSSGLSGAGIKLWFAVSPLARLTRTTSRIALPSNRSRTMKQPELYERFLALPRREGGFIMPNPWDGTSALLLKEAGFEALGTSSAAIASAMGRLDGRHAVSREEHIR